MVSVPHLHFDEHGGSGLQPIPFQIGRLDVQGVFRDHLQREAVSPPNRVGGWQGLCSGLTCATSPAAATEITPVMLLMANMWGWGWSGLWRRME